MRDSVNGYEYMSALRLHPDWRFLTDGTLLNRFTLELFACSEEEQRILEAISQEESVDAPEIESEMYEAGVVTDADEPDSLIERYDRRAKQTDDIRINRARFMITERCNMGCPGCFVRFKYRNDMQFENADREKAHRVVDFLREENHGEEFHIHFLGGEPLIALDLIKETVRYANKTCEVTDFSFSTTTNATVVDEEVARYLDEHDVTVGVSFDGWKELNDQSRMYMSDEGTYDDAVKGYEILNEHLDEGVGILITPQPINIDHLADVARHLVRELSPAAVTINDPFHSNGTWDIDGRQFAEELKEIIQLCERERLPLVSPATQIIDALARERPKLQTLTTGDRKFTLGVSPDGRASYHIMNYDEELFPNPIEEISEERFEQWASFSGYQHEECRQCVALNTCGGPDPIESYHGTGHVETIELNPDHCTFYKEMTRWIGKQL